MLNVLSGYLFFSVRKDTKKSMHFQIISVVLRNNGAVLRIISVISQNHTDDWRMDEGKNGFSSKDERVCDKVVEYGYFR